MLQWKRSDKCGGMLDGLERICARVVLENAALSAYWVRPRPSPPPVVPSDAAWPGSAEGGKGKGQGQRRQSG